MIKSVKGNILGSNAGVACQQVNCQGALGKGLAEQIISKFPAVKLNYKRFCKNSGCAEDLLGQVLYVEASKEAGGTIPNKIKYCKN
jgi:O-acetyl-ADP-ribose deacetylase (regulator of RNase III)